MAPDDANGELFADYGVAKLRCAITKQNYREVLTPLLTAGPGRAFCVNLAVDTSSVAILTLAREIGGLYVDTVIEPWLGFYDESSVPLAQRTNNALRESLLADRRRSPGGSTAVSACGANPGMVSWLVKQALLDEADAVGLDYARPSSRGDWAELMQQAGVKGAHIAERDTHRALTLKATGTFVNTWSVDGFLSEGLQPAELG